MTTWNGVDAQPRVRVPYLDEGDLPEDRRELLSRPINLFRGLANSVGALEAHHQFGEWIRWKSTLGGRLRELVILLVGYLGKSPYEYSHHIGIGAQFGVTDDDVRSMVEFAETGATRGFGEDVLAALTAAAEITREGSVGDDTWAELERHFSAEELTDLVVIASFYVYVVRVLATLRIEVEPAYAGNLDTHPLD